MTIEFLSRAYNSGPAMKELKTKLHKKANKLRRIKGGMIRITKRPSLTGTGYSHAYFCKQMHRTYNTVALASLES